MSHTHHRPSLILEPKSPPQNTLPLIDTDTPVPAPAKKRQKKNDGTQVPKDPQPKRKNKRVKLPCEVEDLLEFQPENMEDSQTRMTKLSGFLIETERQIKELMSRRMRLLNALWDIAPNGAIDESFPLNDISDSLVLKSLSESVAYHRNVASVAPENDKIVCTLCSKPLEGKKDHLEKAITPSCKDTVSQVLLRHNKRRFSDTTEETPSVEEEEIKNTLPPENIPEVSSPIIPPSSLPPHQPPTFLHGSSSPAPAVNSIHSPSSIHPSSSPNPDFLKIPHPVSPLSPNSASVSNKCQNSFKSEFLFNSIYHAAKNYSSQRRTVFGNNQMEETLLSVNSVKAVDTRPAQSGTINTSSIDGATRNEYHDCFVQALSSRPFIREIAVSDSSALSASHPIESDSCVSLAELLHSDVEEEQALISKRLKETEDQMEKKDITEESKEDRKAALEDTDKDGWKQGEYQVGVNDYKHNKEWEDLKEGIFNSEEEKAEENGVIDYTEELEAKAKKARASIKRAKCIVHRYSLEGKHNKRIPRYSLPNQEGNTPHTSQHSILSARVSIPHYSQKSYLASQILLYNGDYYRELDMCNTLISRSLLPNLYDTPITLSISEWHDYIARFNTKLIENYSSDKKERAVEIRIAEDHEKREEEVGNGVDFEKYFDMATECTMEEIIELVHAIDEIIKKIPPVVKKEELQYSHCIILLYYLRLRILHQRENTGLDEIDEEDEHCVNAWEDDHPVYSGEQENRKYKEDTSDVGVENVGQESMKDEKEDQRVQEVEKKKPEVPKQKKNESGNIKESIETEGVGKSEFVFFNVADDWHLDSLYSTHKSDPIAPTAILQPTSKRHSNASMANLEHIDFDDTYDFFNNFVHGEEPEEEYQDYLKQSSPKKHSINLPNSVASSPHLIRLSSSESDCSALPSTYTRQCPFTVDSSDCDEDEENESDCDINEERMEDVNGKGKTKKPEIMSLEGLKGGRKDSVIENAMSDLDKDERHCPINDLNNGERNVADDKNIHIEKNEGRVIEEGEKTTKVDYFLRRTSTKEEKAKGKKKEKKVDKGEIKISGRHITKIVKFVASKQFYNEATLCLLQNLNLSMEHLMFLNRMSQLPFLSEDELLYWSSLFGLKTTSTSRNIMESQLAYVTIYLYTGTMYDGEKREEKTDRGEKGDGEGKEEKKKLQEQKDTQRIINAIRGNHFIYERILMMEAVDMDLVQRVLKNSDCDMPEGTVRRILSSQGVILASVHNAARKKK